MPQREGRRSTERLDWVIGMQSRDGGWAAFDADNTRRLVEKLPFCDFGAVIDPPSADVTAHAVEMLAHCGLGRRRSRPARRAVAARRPGGRRLLVRPVGHQLRLRHRRGRSGAGGGRHRPPTPSRSGARCSWLVEHQNADGGWGEDLRSYTDDAWRGRGASTASQTAWALLALLAADPATRRSTPASAWLVDNQRRGRLLGRGRCTPEPASPATSTSTTRCTGWCSRSARSAATWRSRREAT